jgi:hypothetical protein
MLRLPTDSPADDITFFEHSEGDTFHRIRDDGSRGEPLKFQRDQEGKIVRYVHHQMHSVRLDR